MADERFFSPAEVSQALGVSTSTIKRWVDKGVLPAYKTVGGHRKLPRADVLRLVREGNFPSLDLAILDLPIGDGVPDPATLSSLLFDGLRAGDIALIRSIIHGTFATSLPLETLADEVISPAMAHLGHSWEEGRVDVMHEHRATLLCAGVLHELRPALEDYAETDRPVAVGGNPGGDHSQLASLLIQLMLLDSGWNASNLGPNTPLTSFGVAISELKPRLVWLSVSHLANPETFLSEYRAFYDQALAAGVAVAVGGQGLKDSIRDVMPATYFGSSLSEFAWFARTLHQRPRPPKRGRPFNESA